MLQIRYEIGCSSPWLHLPRGLVTRLGRTPSDSRIMDPCRPDAERGRGLARPPSFLADDRSAGCTLEEFTRSRVRPEGLAPEPAPKRDAPRAVVAEPAAAITLEAFVASRRPASLPTSVPSGATASRGLPSDPAFRRHSTPIDAFARRHLPGLFVAAAARRSHRDPAAHLSFVLPRTHV